MWPVMGRSCRFVRFYPQAKGTPQPEWLWHPCHQLLFHHLAVLLKITLPPTLLLVVCLRDGIPWQGLRWGIHFTQGPHLQRICSLPPAIPSSCFSAVLFSPESCCVHTAAWVRRPCFFFLFDSLSKCRDRNTLIRNDFYHHEFYSLSFLIRITLSWEMNAFRECIIGRPALDEARQQM